MILSTDYVKRPRTLANATNHANDGVIKYNNYKTDTDKVLFQNYENDGTANNRVTKIRISRLRITR